uniref:Uncharacterized protein n=1 Tax=Oreochromis aureus TaxID=47969 RepID=A0AAZ1XCT8_OREAU
MWSEEESDSTSPPLPTTATISAPISRGSGGSTGSEKCHRQNPGPHHCKRPWRSPAVQPSQCSLLQFSLPSAVSCSSAFSAVQSPAVQPSQCSLLQFSLPQCSLLQFSLPSAVSCSSAFPVQSPAVQPSQCSLLQFSLPRAAPACSTAASGYHTSCSLFSVISRL